MRPATPSRTAAAILAVLALLAAPASGAFAQAEGRETEYRVKAAFLYNFSKFVEWPRGAFADDGSPLVLGIVGEDPFGSIIDEFAGKPAAGRTIVVRRFPSADRIGPCHLLYVSASVRDGLPAVFRRAREVRALTVGDADGFARAGGMIGLVPVGDRIGFEVNLDPAAQAGLRISSKLLGLARAVHGGK